MISDCKWCLHFIPYPWPSRILHSVIVIVTFSSSVSLLSYDPTLANRIQTVKFPPSSPHSGSVAANSTCGAGGAVGKYNDG